MRLMALVAGTFMLTACHKDSNLGDRIDRALFSSFGGTVLSSPGKVSMKKRCTSTAGLCLVKK